MCSSKIMSVVETAVDRRGFLRASGAAALGAAAASTLRGTAATTDSSGFPAVEGRFERVIDCTQVLAPGIPSYFKLDLTINNLDTVAKNGFYINQLVVPEHLGTHFDTPSHFIADGITAESIQGNQLIGPLVIIDIADRAATNPNAEVTVQDLEIWERRNGRIPRGALVAMYSNWAARWPTAAYLNADASGTYNFPGFGADAAEFLVSQRDIIGIGCDSHSLDVGSSTTFPAHIAVLGAGKIGVEVIAGLDEVLAARNGQRHRGTAQYPIIFIGGLKTLHGSGSPIRALVLV